MVPASMEIPPANGAAQDLRGPDFLNAPPRAREEVESSLLDFDEAKNFFSGYARAELSKRFNQKPLESKGFVEAMTSGDSLDINARLKRGLKADTLPIRF